MWKKLHQSAHHSSTLHGQVLFFFKQAIIFLTNFFSVVVASKFCDDFFETNTFYSRVGGISVEEMNSLELEFLARLGFDLYVDDAEYQSYDDLIKSVPVLAVEKEFETTLINSCFSPNSRVDIFSCTPAS
jgi:hypothetical protein